MLTSHIGEIRSLVGTSQIPSDKILKDLSSEDMRYIASTLSMAQCGIIFKRASAFQLAASLEIDQEWTDLFGVKGLSVRNTTPKVKDWLSMYGFMNGNEKDYKDHKIFVLQGKPYMTKAEWHEHRGDYFTNLELVSFIDPLDQATVIHFDAYDLEDFNIGAIDITDYESDDPDFEYKYIENTEYVDYSDRMTDYMLGIIKWKPEVYLEMAIRFLNNGLTR